MSITGLRIYYLEDKKSEYKLLRSGLELDNHFFPLDEDRWKDEMTMIDEYLGSSQDRTAKGEEIKNMFKKYTPDIFIFDYYLVGGKKSTTIYAELIENDPELSKIPVVFLTTDTSGETLPLTTITAYVQKITPPSEQILPELLALLEKSFSKFTFLNKKTTLKIHADLPNWLRNNF